MNAAEVPFRILVLALALSAAVCAFAQTTAKAGTTADQKPRSTWHFQLSGSGTWYENAQFLGPALESSAWSTDGSATLSYAHRFQKGSYRLSGFGGAIYYPEMKDLNQPTYGGAFTLASEPSRHTTLTLGQDFLRTSTRYQTVVDAGGLPLPTSEMDTATSTFGLKERLSQQWRLGVDASFAVHNYADERLVDGKQLLANTRLEHQVGRHGGFYLGYGYSSVWFGSEGAQRAHQALIGGRREAERGVGFELAGGVGYVESADTFYPAGRAGLTARGRHASLALFYNREFGQAWGYGRQMISDLASAILTWAASRRLSFNAGYNFGYRRDPADESYTIISSIATAGFNWTVGGGVDLGAYYAWEHNDTKGLPLIEGGRAAATLRYGVDWR